MVYPVENSTYLAKKANITYSGITSEEVSDYTRQTDQHILDEGLKDIKIATFTTLLGVMLTCNVLALYIIYKRKANRRPSIKFTIGLSVENIILGGALLLFLIVSNINGNSESLLVKSIWWPVISIVFTAHLLCSSWMGLLISVDRYIAIKKSLRYTNWITHRTCVVLMLSALTISIGIALLQLTDWENMLIRLTDLSSTSTNSRIYNLIIINLSFPLPLFANCYIYWTIYGATKNTTALARRNSLPPSSSPASTAEEQSKGEEDNDIIQSHVLRRPSLRKLSGQLTVHKDNRKAAKMGVLVLVTQFCIFIPFYIVMFLHAVSGIKSSKFDWLAVACVLIDTIANPIVYVLRNRSSRILMKSFCQNVKHSSSNKSTKKHILFRLVTSQASDDSIQTKLFYSDE